MNRKYACSSEFKSSSGRADRPRYNKRTTKEGARAATIYIVLIEALGEGLNLA